MSIPLNPGQLVSHLSNDMGGSPEQSYIDVSAGTGNFETFTVLMDGSTAQADYLYFVEPDSGTKFAFWFDVDDNGSVPTGATYVAADEQVEVDIAATDTAAQEATKLNDVMGSTAALLEYTASVVGSVVTLVSNKFGSASGIHSYATGGVTAGHPAVAVLTASVSPTVQNKYVTFSGASDEAHYAWFNVNSQGSDPSETGTAAEIAVVAASSNAAVATLLAAAIDGLSGLEAEADGSRVKLTTEAEGDVTDVGAGDSGFVVSVSTQGGSEHNSAAANPASISNNPSAF